MTNPSNRNSEEENDAVVALWKQGKTYAEISVAIRRSVGSVSHITRRLIALGRIKPRGVIAQVSIEASARVIELWNKGASRTQISRVVGISTDKTNAEVRRLLVEGRIAPRELNIAPPDKVAPEDLPPPKPPISRAASLEEYRRQASARGGQKSAAAPKAPPVNPGDGDVLDWIAGATGMPMFPNPKELVGEVPMGGLGAFPEPRHPGYCQWVITPAREASGGWRGIVFCSHAAIRGSAYCPGHHGIAFVPRSDYGHSGGKGG